MQWLVQVCGVDYQNTLNLVKILKSKKKYYSDVIVKPFVDHIEFPKGVPDTPFMLYGSTKLVKLATLSPNTWKSVFTNKDFDVEVWDEKRDDMVNHNPLVMNHSKLIDLYEKDNPVEIFIRPVEDLKAFVGGVISRGEIAGWMERTFVDPEHNNYGSVAIYPAKKIQAEWRCFIVKGEVITISQYRDQGKLVSRPADPKIYPIADELAKGWLPHENVVMDIASLYGEYRIMEFNCLNASGFYACDIEAIIDAIY